MLIDILSSLELSSSLPVKRWGYRKAMVKNRLEEYRYGIDQDESSLQLRRNWARVLRVECSNHECYELKMTNEESIYIQFSDFKVYIGTSIEIKDW